MLPLSALVTNPEPDHTSVQLADGSSISSTMKGNFDPGFLDKSTHPSLVIPNLKEPLLSVSKLSDTGIVSVFDNKECVFINLQLYWVKLLVVVLNAVVCTTNHMCIKSSYLLNNAAVLRPIYYIGIGN